jgi:hypothetical protein
MGNHFHLVVEMPKETCIAHSDMGPPDGPVRLKPSPVSLVAVSMPSLLPRVI